MSGVEVGKIEPEVVEEKSNRVFTIALIVIVVIIILGCAIPVILSFHLDFGFPEAEPKAQVEAPAPSSN